MSPAGRSARGAPQSATQRRKVLLMGLWNSRWLGVRYSPQPEERPFLDRADVRKDDTLVVRASVLANRESERFFGVPLARRGIQAVWLEIANNGGQPYRLRLASLDPNYYPPPGGGVRQSLSHRQATPGLRRPGLALPAA